LQETLLRAWNARSTLQWRGYRAFRSWLLTIADHCIADARERLFTAKRGAGNVGSLNYSNGDRYAFEDPAASTTPSQVARYKEEALIIRAALADLPDDVQEIVRLRLFEQVPLQSIATRLGLPLSTVQHRIRRGAALYQGRLRTALAASTFAAPKVSADPVSKM
jgi:RNA polymerase sigma factor (sigma-70 family)